MEELIYKYNKTSVLFHERKKEDKIKVHIAVKNNACVWNITPNKITDLEGDSS